MPISSQAARKARQARMAMNDSPMQQRLRQERAWFIGPVYWKPGDYEPAEVERELTRIRDLGFNMVRFHTADPVETAPGEYDFSRPDEWMAIAEEVGLGVFLHVPLANPSDGILTRHGLTREQFERFGAEEPGVQAALEDVIRPVASHFADHPALMGWGGLGEPNAQQGDIENDYDRQRFGRWLEDKYGTLDALDEAWTLYPEKGKPVADSFAEAWKAVAGFRADWQVSGVHMAKRNYGAGRDILRYLTDKSVDRTRLVAELVSKYDPNHPVSVGSHQLFVNPASLRWDTADRARVADLHFTSIHLSWHFELTAGEVDRPVYMQARQTRDYFKEGWTSAYETTGGAVQYSGGYGNAMTPGLMRRLTLSYLAAGNVNVAYWTWNHRPGGWESGEYGMTSLSGAITDWASEAGAIGRGMGKYIDELWQGDPQTHVGLLEAWDTDAILTLEPERHDLREGVGKLGRGTAMQAQRARIGLARAMINHHVPFEYVTDRELLEGIAACYPVIYAPHMRAVSDEVLEVLEAYVREGGVLIADVQMAFQDPWGKVRPTGPGGWQDRLFGAYVDVIHDARTATVSLADLPVEGFFGDIEVTDARVAACLSNGRPGITERDLGSGKAVLLATDAARMCWKPGRADVEAMLAGLVTRNHRPGWRCTAEMAFRLRCPGADHYFLLNDGPEKLAFLEACDAEYSGGVDVVEDRPVDVAETGVVTLPAESGLWLRMARKS